MRLRQRATQEILEQTNEAFWSLSLEAAFATFTSSRDGLSLADVAPRLALFGTNETEFAPRLSALKIALNQIMNPLVLLLIFAALTSMMVGQWIDAIIVSIIILSGAGIGTLREYQAQHALQRLWSKLRRKTIALRDGRFITLDPAQLVPGDIVELNTGDIVPADGLLIESNHLYVNQSSISGESFPVFKRPVPEGLGSAIPLSERVNSVFWGSYVQSGSGQCLIARTGQRTLFGAIATSLARPPPFTDFDKGMRAFGQMVIRSMSVMILVILAINALKVGMDVQVFMFAVSLAVGLSPELLPLIVNYNLAVGAASMGKCGVLVRHFKAIENLGSMDILCTDKTGTLTEGAVSLSGAYDTFGNESHSVLRLGKINAAVQSGLSNPLDHILVNQKTDDDMRAIQKLAEIPYDFQRKRISVVVKDGDLVKVITKGSFKTIMAICQYDEIGSLLTEHSIRRIEDLFEKWSERGSRVLGVAGTQLPLDSFTADEIENRLSFLGFLVFEDRVKKGIESTLTDLTSLGVKIKILTGDNALATKALARQIGLKHQDVIVGTTIEGSTDEALAKMVNECDLFSELEPKHKEKIILILQKFGHAVGFMGDGINDVMAIRAADASISVDDASDIVKSAADFILLEKNLEILKNGIVEGRTAFLNSIKYINITMSANLGNMISMAFSTLFLPFLPLLPSQILLNNLLSDVPALGLARDYVDRAEVLKPTRWNTQSIVRFMIVFGLVSSLFDIVTFYVLERVVRSRPEEFRTAWFMFSLLTELAVVMILRTRLPFYRSQPRKLLVGLVMLMTALTFLLPHIPFAWALGFTPVPSSLLIQIIFIAVLYLLTTEITKLGLAKTQTRAKNQARPSVIF